MQSSVPAGVATPPQNQGSPAASVTVANASGGVAMRPGVQPVVIAQASKSPQVMQQLPVDDNKILSRQRLQELVKEIDPSEQLDDDVEEMLMQVADDFIESIVGSACDLAKHRNSKVLEVKDLKLHLEKHWNITVPGYGSDEIRPFKKPVSTEAHKQRLALVRKGMKK